MSLASAVVTGQGGRPITDIKHIDCCFDWLGGTRRTSTKGLRRLDDWTGLVSSVHVLIVFNKEMYGKLTGDGPELSEAISLLFLIRKSTENDKVDGPELSEAISSLFWLRKCMGNERGRALRSNFLIVQECF